MKFLKKFVDYLLSFIIENIQGDRLLVSAETDLIWLSKFSNLSMPTHQLVGVPAYEDGAYCGRVGYGEGGIPVRERKSIKLILNFYHYTGFPPKSLLCFGGLLLDSMVRGVLSHVCLRLGSVGSVETF